MTIWSPEGIDDYSTELTTKIDTLIKQQLIFMCLMA